MKLPLPLVLLMAAAPSRAASFFGDVRDRLGCQLPGHTHYPFCNVSLSATARAADLVSRIAAAVPVFNISFSS